MKPLDQAFFKLEVAEKLYLEFFNDYLTILKFASDKGLSVEEAEEIVKVGKVVNSCRPTKKENEKEFDHKAIAEMITIEVDKRMDDLQTSIAQEVDDRIDKYVNGKMTDLFKGFMNSNTFDDLMTDAISENSDLSDQCEKFVNDWLYRSELSEFISEDSLIKKFMYVLKQKLED